MLHLTIKSNKKKSLIYLRDYFESLSLPSNRLMKHTSMLDLIILHKGEGGKKKKVYSGITSPGMGLGILVVPFSRVRKIPRCGCSFFVLCSFIANKHTVCYCFPTRTSELRKYSFFFSFCSSKMKYRSVSYISLLQFGKHFRSIFKV